jgi:dolichol-phosphate mannosyltransferase
MLDVSIVIPTYNEAKNLPSLLEGVFQVINKAYINAEVIIVDDNSPDGTAEVAEQLKSKFPLKVLKRAGKLGLGSAVIEGFALSARSYLGVMDADLSHDPAILNDLILGLSEYNVTIGSRFERGSSVEDWTWWRKLLSECGVAFARLITKVKDPLSGYFFLRRSVIEGVELNTKGYKILLEILVKGRYERVKEIPFMFRKRTYGTSKLNHQEYLLFIKQLITYTGHKLFSKFR